MPTSTHEHRIRMLEENYAKLESKIEAGAVSLATLTGRVDAIAKSLDRIEKTIDRFTTFFINVLKWFASVTGAVAGGTILWYITTHFLAK